MLLLHARQLSGCVEAIGIPHVISATRKAGPAGSVRLGIADDRHDLLGFRPPAYCRITVALPEHQRVRLGVNVRRIRIVNCLYSIQRASYRSHVTCQRLKQLVLASGAGRGRAAIKRRKG